VSLVRPHGIGIESGSAGRIMDACGVIGSASVVDDLDRGDACLAKTHR